MTTATHFQAGERVEVIASDGYHTAGQQGTVKSASHDLVFVVLDKQPDLLPGIVIVDVFGGERRVASVFTSSEIRHVVIASA